MRMFFATLLLLLTSTANAVNTYDGSTGILTIPSVMVGNTIYTNVVLKEINFQIVSLDPNPLPGLVLNGALYTYNGCYHAANNLTCNMTITAQNKSITLQYCYGSFSLIDDRGNSYRPNFLQIGNNTSLDCGNVTFAANVQTGMQINFPNIATNATALSMLTLNGGSTISFTNQPFISGQAPNPF